MGKSFLLMAIFFKAKMELHYDLTKSKEPGKSILLLASVPHKKFHVLRHTHATQLLANGVPLLEVSKRLGHSRASHTLDLYGHAIPGYDASLPNKISKIFNL